MGRKISVAVDFGNRYTGISFSHTDEKSKIRTVEEWPGQTLARLDQSISGSDCRTLTGLWYAEQADGRLKMVHWGWLAQREHIQLLSSSDAKRKSFVHFFVTDFRYYLQVQPSFVVASGRRSNDPRFRYDTVTAAQATTHYLEAVKEFTLNYMRNVYETLGLDVDEKQVQWLLLVPRLWDRKGRNVLQGCAKLAGLSRLELKMDDEAAVAFYLKTLPPDERRKTGDVPLVDMAEELSIFQHTVVADSEGNVRTVARTKSFNCGETRVDQEFVTFLTTKFTNFASMVHSKPGALPPEVTAILVQWEAIKRQFAAGSHEAAMKLDIPERVHVSAAWKMSAGNPYPPPEHIVDGNRYELVLTPADVSSILDRVAEAALRNLNEILPGDDQLFLLARASSSPYLCAWVQQRANRVVTMLPDSDRALSQGAFLPGLISASTPDCLVGCVAFVGLFALQVCVIALIVIVTPNDSRNHKS